MGCITSSKRIRNELSHDGVFRFRAILQPTNNSANAAASLGCLELNSRELIFTTRTQHVIWALQHLRRYGVNGEIFSFEAGRRCITGPGIYTFHCQHAEILYQKFQQYVNAMAGTLSEDTSLFPIRDHPSHTLGRPDTNSHANNYLEPTPLNPILRASVRESANSSSRSLELDSPDSVPSLSFTNEVVHFQSHPNTPALFANGNSNVYLEHPLGSSTENNNNNAHAKRRNSNVVSCESESHNLNSMARKRTLKRCSLDIPPDECAPMILDTTTVLDKFHFYANVDGLGKNAHSFIDNCMDPTERCYENLNRLDGFSTIKKSYDQHQSKATQTQDPLSSGVNYIVLDLEPRSPAQYSSKTCFGSDYSLMSANAEGFGEVQSLPTVPLAISANGPKPKINSDSESQQRKSSKEDVSQGYSTIDFIKTCALIKSSTHSADFDHEQDERITRHSKCVRKAYSISE